MLTFSPAYHTIPLILCASSFAASCICSCHPDHFHAKLGYSTQHPELMQSSQGPAHHQCSLAVRLFLLPRQEHLVSLLCGLSCLLIMDIAKAIASCYTAANTSTSDAQHPKLNTRACVLPEPIPYQARQWSLVIQATCLPHRTLS